MPDNYPYKSPSIGFCNRIFHPNVDEMCVVCPQRRTRLTLPAPYTPCRPPAIAPPRRRCAHRPAQCSDLDCRSGSVCLDVINQTWSPMFELLNVFETFLPQLLLYPNPTDPLNGEAASLLMREPAQYNAKVKGAVQLHVKPCSPSARRGAASSHTALPSRLGCFLLPLVRRIRVPLRARGVARFRDAGQGADDRRHGRRRRFVVVHFGWLRLALSRLRCPPPHDSGFDPSCAQAGRTSVVLQTILRSSVNALRTSVVNMSSVRIVHYYHLSCPPPLGTAKDQGSSVLRYRTGTGQSIAAITPDIRSHIPVCCLLTYS